MKYTCLTLVQLTHSRNKSSPTTQHQFLSLCIATLDVHPHHLHYCQRSKYFLLAKSHTCHRYAALPLICNSTKNSFQFSFSRFKLYLRHIYFANSYLLNWQIVFAGIFIFYLPDFVVQQLRFDIIYSYYSYFANNNNIGWSSMNFFLNEQAGVKNLVGERLVSRIPYSI